MAKEETITHFNASPAVTRLFCANPLAEILPKFVYVTVAGGPPAPHLLETMTNLNLEPLHVYGQTETYGPITKGYHMPAQGNIPLKEKYRKMARQGHGFIVDRDMNACEMHQSQLTTYGRYYTNTYSQVS
ncbi:MAG: hypothetical protein M1813_006510 [Trichoglossum hirsutum]|jgi:acyl-coenzyme A synthetase/AMP-(fatty) acid ligase|nr:MAG: hypothetical protein M1813_006510 [Trichoglossum hirsutum]